MKAATVKSPDSSRFQRPSADVVVERWLEPRTNLVVGLILASAFGLRLAASLGTFLNPDEALHFLLVNQPSVGAAYRASLTNAHPPLYFFFLYFWRFWGTSEVMLRLPSVVAGTAAAWITFQWIRLVLGTSAGFVGLILASFCPPLVGLGAEVRGYALLLLCLASALYFLERAFRDKSTAMIVWCSLGLYLAVLTHYSALWFTIALGIYTLLRIREWPRRAAAVWALFQSGAGAIYAFLYITHISKLRGSAMESDASAGWLQALYYHAGSRSVIAFVRDATTALFAYFLSLSAGAEIALLVFVAAVVWLVSGVRRRGTEVPWTFGILLVLPFAVNALAGIADVYPYGGTRHCVYLSLFAIAGFSYLLSKGALRKIWPVLTAAVLLVPVWTMNAELPPQQMRPQAQKTQWMREALDYLRQSAPEGSIVFTDSQAGSMLGYYLGREQALPPPHDCGGFRENTFQTLRVVTDANWSMPAGTFLGRVNEWHASCHPEVNSVWVFDGGWDENVLDGIRLIAPSLYSQDRRLGAALSVFQLSLGPDLP
jgi:hypothetical protein